MPVDDKIILVVGATGMLGQPVVHELDHFGFPVRILSRNPGKAKKLFGEHFEIVQGDINDPESLRAALEDCHGVHINLKGGPKPKDFDRIEHRGTAAIVNTALKTGVKRITYLSGCTVCLQNCWFPMVKAKYYAEQAIINSGLEYSIFRAAWFAESLPLFVRDNQATIMGNQPHKLHWLAAEDYARMVVKSYLSDDAANKIFTIFGPEAYTFKEAFEIYRTIINPEIKVSNVPLAVLSFFAAITFSKQLKEVIPLMKYFEKNSEQGDPSETDDILGAPWITLEQWCKNYREHIRNP